MNLRSIYAFSHKKSSKKQLFLTCIRETFRYFLHPYGQKGRYVMKWLNFVNKKFVLAGFVVILFLDTVSVCPAVEYIWTRKADMSTPRNSHTSAVVDGKIYVIGGRSKRYEDILYSVEEYAQATNTWTQKTDMPTARDFLSPSSPVVDGKIYVIGGVAFVGGSSSTVEEYDPVTDTWTQKADMPTPRDSMATVAVDEKIYVIGGSTDGSEGLNVVEQYDPLTDTWTRKANMPVGLWGLCANVVNGEVYTFGGAIVNLSTNYVFEYDVVNDTWTQKADMPVASKTMASVVLDEKIFVIGGSGLIVGESGLTFNAVQVYDPETDTWSRENDLPFPREYFTADIVNNRIYAIGGFGKSTDIPWDTPALSTVFEFGPLVDFNWDGIVDIDDLVLLIEHWEQEESLYDIAPLPFGDGVVDKTDLDDFMNCWGQEILPFDLLTYLRLDETEGNIAYDSAVDSDGTLNGNPIWQPQGGMIDGALEFDGSDDYISVPLVFGSEAVPLSVFAWIKGGAPGQVIFSQVNRSDWLCADAADGSLMTGLKFLGKPSQTLQSQAIITDGQWHRVGLVWDGSSRILYVDDAEVASDAYEAGLLLGDLQIGAGNKLEAGTFWSGLIVDVRIYNRAITP
jgi:N-acetylneuraminic acid mutarotase